MKKLISMILMMSMILTLAAQSALACEQNAARTIPAIPQDEGTADNVYDDDVQVAIEADTRTLYGVKDVTGEPPVVAEKMEGEIVRGFFDDGMNRTPGMAICSVMEDGTVVGLKTLTNVKTIIDPEQAERVAGIVARRMGEDVPVCNKTLMASTLWKIGNAVAHIFFQRSAMVVRVGIVIFNGGKDIAILYAGDFDGDGYWELGFMFGLQFPEWIPAVEPEPESVVTPKPSCQQPKQSSQSAVKICWDWGVEATIKVGAWFKGCITFLQGFGKGTGK